MGAKIAQRWRWCSFRPIPSIKFMSMADESKLVPSQEFIDQIARFVEVSDPLRASRNLRRVFFDYLRFQEGMTATEFDAIITDIENLMDLLDTIAIETKAGATN
jgi:hypothetical protein